MATKSNLAVLVQGCLLLMTGAVATVSLVGIGMLSPGCSPRNKLISKMDTWGGEHSGGVSPRTETGQCDVEGE